MKTPDEIKKGLECCSCLASCDECPYQVYVDGSFGCDERGCDDGLLPDALAYIQQLEAERNNYREELKTELGCNTCKHFDNDAGAVSGICMHCNMWSNWEWRGVQKEE